LKRDGYEPHLKKSRWLLLKRPENLTGLQAGKLAELVRYNLRTVRSYLLKEDFQQFWEYVSPGWAGKFLDAWCTRTMRSKVEPMKKVAAMLRNHRDLILNWFVAKGTITAGVVEGLNSKAKLTTRKAFGFRSPRVAEIALLHTLGQLPEPISTHRFC
jgi:transposase